jgi:hypothetical protein
MQTASSPSNVVISAQMERSGAQHHPGLSVTADSGNWIPFLDSNSLLAGKFAGNLPVAGFAQHLASYFIPL